MIKKYKKNLIISTILFFVTFPFAAIGHHYVLIIASIGYATAAFFFLDDHSSKKENIIKCAILLAYPTILLTPLYFIDFESAEISFPSTLAYFLGAMFGVWLKRAKRYRIVMITVFLGCIFTAAFVGYDYWLHKINFDSFSGKVDEFEPIFELQQADGKKLSSENFSGKTIVLDFWNTGCGICFQDFPLVAELKNRIESENSNVVFYTVNVPLSRDTPDRISRTAREIPYDFRHLFARNFAEAEKFGVQVYPTIIVLKNKRIIYRGRIDNLNKFLQNEGEGN